MTASALAMKAMAIEAGSSVVHDGLTAWPEGTFSICGRRCSLNEAIIYLGNRAVTRAKAARA